ncbi:MAG: phosphatidate cytidylyltransferase [Rhodopseudomonas palustris]|nr:phosphatidate cytidylyltransferase [Rhodopseudomonas palustris]
MPARQLRILLYRYVERFILGGWAAAAVSISDFPNGMYWLLTVFPIVSLADTGGYLLGRWFGKHKMIPLVSPKKSWEGFLAVF